MKPGSRIKRGALWLIAAVAGQTFLAAPCADAQEVQWKVVNPYPFFMDAGDWERLKPDDGATFEDWVGRLQRQAEARTQAREPLWPASTKTWWDEGKAERGSYSRKGFKEGYLTQPVNVLVWLSDAPAGNCQWKLPEETTKPCNAPVTIATPPETDATVTVVLPGGEKRTTGSPIRVKREIILAMGDSYSSGEGNPDRPIRFCQQPSKEKQKTPEPADAPCIPHDFSGEGPGWFTVAALQGGIRKADWLDDQCHRSLYSYQNLVAMWHAERASQEEGSKGTAVYFIPLACSGAEIRNGILQAQKWPPGGKKAETVAQLEAAKSVLGCDGGNLGCRYPPSTIMLSIGGNDAYFSSVIAATLIPKRGKNIFRSAILFLLRKSSGMDHVIGNANYRIEHPEEIENDVKEMLASFNKAGLFSRKERTKMLATGYPDFLHREDGSWCSQGCTPSTEYSGDYSSDKDVSCRSSANHGMNHIKLSPFVFRSVTKKWQLRITGDNGCENCEQATLKREITEIINGRIEESYRTYNSNSRAMDIAWIPAPHEVERHGICAVQETNKDNPRMELDWPSADADGQWARGLSPLTWNAYARRARWFRTPNDAYQTQMSSEGLPEGAFHPTVEYHMAMACEVAKALGDLPGESCRQQ